MHFHVVKGQFPTLKSAPCNRTLRHVSQAKRSLNYNRSRKTVNTRENFWNVYCFVTNEKRDETAKDNRQTAA